jgi:hypothetical protein
MHLTADLLWAASIITGCHYFKENILSYELDKMIRDDSSTGRDFFI